MGVPGIEYFFSYKKSYKKTISIDHEIQTWKRQHPNAKPLIVFDGTGLFLQEDKFICGGSSLEFDNSLQKFLIRLKQLDVKLVFFLDLNLEKVNKEFNWMDRKNEEFDKQVQLYEKMEKGMRISDLIRHHRTQGTFASPNFLPIALKYGEIKFGKPYQVLDQELARYARKNKAMAIFSADTDFLIFNGHAKWWHYDEIDFEKFTAIEYSGLAFRRELDIQINHLPLLATLMGNDYMAIYKKELKSFRKNLAISSTSFRSFDWPPKDLKKVATYIKNIRFPLNESDIDKIINDVLQNDSAKTAKIKNLIIESIESYDVQSEQAEQVERSHSAGTFRWK